MLYDPCKCTFFRFIMQTQEAEIIYEILEKFTQQKYYYIISK